MTGTEMLINSALKSMKLDPEAIKGNIAAITTNIHTITTGVVGTAGDVKKCLKNQETILDILGGIDAKLEILLSNAKTETGEPLIKPELVPLSPEEQEKLVGQPWTVCGEPMSEHEVCELVQGHTGPHWKGN